MWVKLFRAEWYKITGHRWATGCMIWVFPALAILVVIFGLFAAMVSTSFRENYEANLWTDLAIIPWFIPNNPLGRGLLIGFTAVLFAGEYQWNTWKVIVPRSQRIPLILVKFFAVALFVVFAFILMSIIWGLGGGLLALATGTSYGPALDNRDVLSDFAKDYGLQMLYAFISTMIAAGYASLAAMITRSILGSAITGIIVAIGETMLLVPLYLLASLFDIDSIFHIYRFLPSYNLLNLLSWLSGETPEGLELPSGKMLVDSQLFSEVVLVCWVIGLISLTAYLFQRQDITN
jgi:hypothetical protein